MRQVLDNPNAIMQGPNVHPRMSKQFVESVPNIILRGINTFTSQRLNKNPDDEGKIRTGNPRGAYAIVCLESSKIPLSQSQIGVPNMG